MIATIRRRSTIIGAVAVVGGLLLMLLSHTGGTAYAGGQVRCTTGPIPTVDVGSFQQVPTCTPTRVRLKTHTPTVTDTPEPTDTPLPTNTPAPTSTPKPVGTSEAVSVKPPDTGSGGAAAGGTLTWLLGLGAGLALLGGGSIAAGVRRKR